MLIMCFLPTNQVFHEGLPNIIFNMWECGTRVAYLMKNRNKTPHHWLDDNLGRHLFSFSFLTLCFSLHTLQVTFTARGMSHTQSLECHDYIKCTNKENCTRRLLGITYTTVFYKVLMPCSLMENPLTDKGLLGDCLSIPRKLIISCPYESFKRSYLQQCKFLHCEVILGYII